MKLEYGLGLASLDKMQLPETIKIKYIGRFNFSKTNAIYHISRTRDSITMTPVKTNISIKDKVLFTYNGYIKILNCTVGRRNIIVNSKYIDEWNKIVTEEFIEVIKDINRDNYECEDFRLTTRDGYYFDFETIDEE